MKDLKRVEVKSRRDLRKWLSAHHGKSESIWLVTYKKTEAEWYLDYDSIVEEALCFGWIDSLPRALDSHRTMLRLSPRNPKSAWSQKNRERVKDLIDRGLMTAAGLKAIERAKESGAWSALKVVDHLSVPADLKAAFKKIAGSEKNFNLFPQSSRRAILEWITLAKTPPTRAKRILETARLASRGIRANHYRQPKKAGRTIQRPAKKGSRR